MFHRIFKIGLVAALCAAAAFLAYHFRIWERDWSHIDDGWASLIGSAVGAFLAVVGALYVSKAEERRKKKAFEDFVRLAVQTIVIQASYLEAMAREPHKLAATPEEQYGIVSIQMRSLTDALAVFDREIAHSKDGDYQLRRTIIQLDAMLAESRDQLTMNIDPRAINIWHHAAYQVRWHASNSLREFGWIIPQVTTQRVGEMMKAAVETWRAWGMPADRSTIAPSHSPQYTPLNIPQRAHA